MEKGEIALNEQFKLFPQCFPLIATFQLSSSTVEFGTVSKWCVRELVKRSTKVFLMNYETIFCLQKSKKEKRKQVQEG